MTVTKLDPINSIEDAFALAEAERSIVNHRLQIIRARLVESQGGLCAYCGQPMTKPTLDHIVAKSNGGTDDEANFVAACEPCNVAKGNLSADQFRALLAQAPTR